MNIILTRLSQKSGRCLPRFRCCSMLKNIQSAMLLKTVTCGQTWRKGYRQDERIDRELAMMDDEALTSLSGKTQTGFHPLICP